MFLDAYQSKSFYEAQETNNINSCSNNLSPLIYIFIWVLIINLNYTRYVAQMYSMERCIHSASTRDYIGKIPKYKFFLQINGNKPSYTSEVPRLFSQFSTRHRAI